MSTELIGILSVGVALAALLRSGIKSFREDMNASIKSLREDMKNIETRLSERLTAMERGQAELRERLAHLEGLLEGLREAVAGRTIAQ